MGQFRLPKNGCLETIATSSTPRCPIEEFGGHHTTTPTYFSTIEFLQHLRQGYQLDLANVHQRGVFDLLGL